MVWLWSFSKQVVQYSGLKHFNLELHSISWSQLKILAVGTSPKKSRTLRTDQLTLSLMSANSTKLHLIFSVPVCDPPLDGLLPSFIHPLPTQKSRDPVVKKECVHGGTCLAQNWISLCKIEY
jgi:hypothetical protein